MSLLYREDVKQSLISVLQSPTRTKLSSMLDSRKILCSDAGLNRDWRGLGDYARLPIATIRSSKISPTQHCLHLWCERGGLIKDLFDALEKMDRYDVIDDTLFNIYNDYDDSVKDNFLPSITSPMAVIDAPLSLEEFDSNILTFDDKNNFEMGRGLQQYDALVLHAEEDLYFIEEMVDSLEGTYGLKLCLIHRDLIGGLQFEYEAVVRLIKERCVRVIVVLSDSFLKSNINKFFTYFALALGLEKSQRIVIPCKIKPCESPDVIKYSHSLDYFRAQNKYWNYWQRLAQSVTHTSKSTLASSRPDVIPRALPSAPQQPIVTLPESPQNSLVFNARENSKSQPKEIVTNIDLSLNITKDAATRSDDVRSSISNSYLESPPSSPISTASSLTLLPRCSSNDSKRGVKSRVKNAINRIRKKKKAVAM